jgi:ATP-dependent DNA ligase
MHARLDRGDVRLLTRTGLNWTHKYPAIAAAVATLGARQAYLDGELCGVPDGITSFSMIQAASYAGNASGLVYFIFDLLHLDGDDVRVRPLIERKARLANCCRASRRPCITATITAARARRSISRPASSSSRASSRNAPMRYTRPATGATLMMALSVSFSRN